MSEHLLHTPALSNRNEYRPEDVGERPLYLTVDASARRLKDRHLAVIEQWPGGCIHCGSAEVRASLPGSNGALTLPLCATHTRWAMACRHEKTGKQARHLKKLLLAWCRLKGDNPEVARRWLGY